MTGRLEQALTKLYNAFHGGSLQPECAMGCAVGNILDNKDSWKHLSDEHGSLELNYLGRVHEVLGRKFNGYKPSELLQIEHVFLNACGYQTPLGRLNKKPENPTDKSVQFKGLCAVVTYLCALDNVEDVMRLNDLFLHEDGKAKHVAHEILAN